MMNVNEIEQLAPRFRNKGCISVTFSTSNDRPDLTLTHPSNGVISVSFSDDDLSLSDRIKALNHRIASLRTQIPEIEKLPEMRVLVSSEPPSSNERLGKISVLSLNELADGEWLEQEDAKQVDAESLRIVSDRLQPQMQFVARQRNGAKDQGAEDRAIYRFTLDAEQAATAQRDVDDVLIVSGAPGSGKTLVLVARARWLAQQHPEWKIVVLVYNRLLAKHLESLLKEHPNVQVSTFGMFCRQNGHRISLNDENHSKSDADALIGNGLKAAVDALLIDEWQDFYPAWITYSLQLLRPHRGGLCLAGDDKQAIYRDAAPWDALRNHHVEEVTLGRPYRSTRQILEVVGRLDGTFETSGADLALDGEPVDLIRADDWNGQADVISWEIRRMLDSGDRLPSDIAVLVTQRMATLNRLPSALESRGIPFEILDGSELPNPSKVSVLTVHQSKGYEFNVVFLMALEALPKLTSDPEASRRCRVGFVGPTRARDQLMITYTRPNEFLRNIRECREDVLRGWNFPDDYEGV